MAGQMLCLNLLFQKERGNSMNEAIQFSLEHTQEIVLFFRDNGKITYANRAARTLLGYEDPPEECTIADIFPAEFSLENNTLHTGLVYGEELIWMNAYRKNRTCCPVLARVMRFSDPPDAFCCMAYDASERVLLTKQNEQVKRDAEEALKVKSEFIATVTHELRTPVNGILGNTMELAEIETDERKKRLLSLIERGCADMNAIINNILDFSKLEAGKFTLEPREFNFRNMIDYVKSNHMKKISDKGLDFIVSVSPDIPEILVGDELRIEQILNNLLSNACKFTTVGRIILEVVLTSRVEGQIELFFLVIDTGIGIDKAGMDKLFQSFSQVDASISRRFGGTGLGLNICKQLVELMNGNIHVESEPQKGSTFSFHIWLQVPERELKDVPQQFQMPDIPARDDTWDYEKEQIFIYGTKENTEEIDRKMSRLILAVELENWEKAEQFMEALRKLTGEAPKAIKNAVLRLKMAVQRGDYDKTVSTYEALKELMDQTGEE
jgi:signal transduction histidine kinase